MTRKLALSLLVLLFATGILGLPPISASQAAPPRQPLADDPSPPASPVKLIFIHHSTGGNWLADPNAEQSYGGLGRALMDNNYFVSATNYGWGPDLIGSNTDIGYWWDWFRGDNSAAYTAALYAESGQNFCNPTADPPYECFGAWPRLAADPSTGSGQAPGGENVIVMFKGCFPNAHLSGSPSDPAAGGDNPLRGQSAWLWDDGLGRVVPNPNHTVANAKGIYNDILQYFATRQDKLFIVVAGPPLLPDDMGFPTDAAHAANYRAFNAWLVNDWLDSYPHNNVAVFDYYNVLTSNGGDPETNDAGQEGGNHHRWWNGAVQYVHPVANDLSAYGLWADSHPTTAGQQKAAAEFVQLLNVFYHRWQSGSAAAPPTATPEAQPAGDSTPQPTAQGSPAPPSDGVIDDFETGFSHSSEGDRAVVELSLDRENPHSGAVSLRAQFDVQPGGWGSFGRYYDEPQDWSAGEALTFWLRVTKPGQVFTVNLFSGDAISPTPFTAQIVAPPESASGWAQIILPWADFTRAEWADANGLSSLDPARITGYSVSFADDNGGQNTGVLWIDDVTIISTESPAPHPTAEAVLSPANTATPLQPTAIAPTEQPGESRPGSGPCLAGGAALVAGIAPVLWKKRRRGAGASG